MSLNSRHGYGYGKTLESQDFTVKWMLCCMYFLPIFRQFFKLAILVKGMVIFLTLIMVKNDSKDVKYDDNLIGPTAMVDLDLDLN